MIALGIFSLLVLAALAGLLGYVSQYDRSYGWSVWFWTLCGVSLLLAFMGLFGMVQ